jgi:general secretion pathway protein G
MKTKETRHKVTKMQRHKGRIRNSVPLCLCASVPNNKGFTLIELMLVIIIIGTLAAMVMPRLVGRSEQARIAAARADVNTNIATALKLYEVDNGCFPSTEEGIEALLSKSTSATNWNGPYLEREPIDPWGREYQYKCPGKHRTYDYDLCSLGKDGKESEDDITNWK